jgi:hypothetical protein
MVVGGLNANVGGLASKKNENENEEKHIRISIFY